MTELESQGGDNRPSVYFDPDVDLWVYRASALGHCERELVALRRGGVGQPVPDWLMRRFNEGHEFEAELLQRYVEDNGGDLILEQHQVIIPAGKDAAVRGSMDGYDAKLCAVVDAKFLGPDLYRKLKKEGIAGSSAYKWQQPVYVQGLINEGYAVEKVCLAMGLKQYEEREDPDTGETYNAAVGVAEMHYEWVDVADLPGVGAIKSRVVKLERLAKADADEWPACPVPFQFPCGFDWMHDEPEDTAVELVGESAVKLTTAHRLYYAGAELEKGAKKLKAEAGDIVRELLTEQGLEVDAAGNKLRAGDTAMTWAYTAPTSDEVIPEYVKKGRKASAYPKFSETKDIGW